jgi:hypothetical protein
MKQYLEDIIETHKKDIRGDTVLLLKSTVKTELDRDCFSFLYQCASEIALQEEEDYATVVYPKVKYEVIGLMSGNEALKHLNRKNL